MYQQEILVIATSTVHMVHYNFRHSENIYLCRRKYLQFTSLSFLPSMFSAFQIQSLGFYSWFWRENAAHLLKPKAFKCTWVELGFSFSSACGGRLRERDLEKLEARIGRAKQSHYIEVAQGAVFMEQKMRFGLILGWLAILKKKLGRFWTTFVVRGNFF